MKRNPFQAISSLWALPSAQVMAAKEYEDAQRQLLIAQRDHAYTGKLVEFYQSRIDALTPVVSRKPTLQYVER